ncbi:MAG TPA: hypothetical protein VH370_20515 [Humisphaera sp.]|jgi:hypothetical protein|nr:hypothetical protein [Humisphaera sp.]
MLNRLDITPQEWGQGNGKIIRDVGKDSTAMEDQCAQICELVSERQEYRAEAQQYILPELEACIGSLESFVHRLEQLKQALITPATPEN